MEMNLYQKINEVKKTVKSFLKDDKTKGKGAYTYVSGAQILRGVKDKMEELNLLFIPVSTEHGEWTTFNYKTSYGDKKTDFIVRGKLTYEWINADNPEERQKLEMEYYGQQNDISKAYGSGLTYSERYALLKSLGAPTDEDDPDRNNIDKAQIGYQPYRYQQEPAPSATATPCSNCGASIVNTTKRDGSPWMASEIVSYSTNRFGRILCPACQKQAFDKEKFVQKEEDRQRFESALAEKMAEAQA